MSDESGDGARDRDSAVEAGDDAVTGDRSRANDAGEKGPDGGTEWRFSVDDVGPDGVTEDTATPADEPIEPGDITLEHAAFVVLGVALTVGTLVVGL
ncbi:hypothetical protein PM035_01540 [Halorubrum ezzemoulense]|uniref:DUF7312 domain-containing protein n=1 Tax=Halorubrum ezzemoulense TaxID=337243 RepID=UPI00232E53A5|nr:hypothetical protein [Halorubrum ezzemoulense]MDB2259561.1 hypothetical protein [Halorubrum ezzemoulense]MDB2266380.1 hypothetical protein [Halorubrum ezzemoulense]